MTPAQWNEYQRQADVIEKHAKSMKFQISDEEIEKASIIHCGEKNSGSIAFVDGARWYREQLKNKI